MSPHRIVIAFARPVSLCTQQSTFALFTSHSMSESETQRALGRKEATSVTLIPQLFLLRTFVYNELKRHLGIFSGVK